MRFVAALTVACIFGFASTLAADDTKAFKAAVGDVECSTFLWLFGTMAKQNPERLKRTGIADGAESFFAKALALELRAQERLGDLPESQRDEAQRELIIEHHKFRLWITEMMPRADDPSITKEEKIELNSVITRCLLARLGLSNG